jgi:hypothetical protein
VAHGCFVYANHAAAFSACFLPLAILVARERATPWAWLVPGALALAVVLSASRGGIIIAAAINLPLAWRVLPRRRRALWFGALLIGVSGYLALIGVGEVGAKFAQLRGPQGLTLAGRADIWRASLPLIGDAGPLGSGAGTAERAYWRIGDPSFPGLTVNHLHSDPLEWTLEFGWAGALAIAIGLAALAWRLRPARREGAWVPADAMLYWGGMLGLLQLSLHSVVDFIWNREAIALAAIALFILALEGRSEHREREIASTRWVRLVALALAVVLAALVPGAWKHDADGKLARDAQAYVDGRRAAGLDQNGEVVDRLLAAEPHSAALAVTQARVAMSLPGSAKERQARLDQARLALRRAADELPGDAGAWVERARLAALAPHERSELHVAIARAMTWASTWSYAQVQVLDCLRRAGRDLLDDGERRQLVRQVLELDLPQPQWFFVLAQGIVGTDELAERLTHAGPALVRSAMPWLSEHAPLEQWRARWSDLAPEEIALEPSRALLATQLLGAKRTIAIRLSSTAEFRRQQAEGLQTAGLPLPRELVEALRADGAPWDLWALDDDLADDAARARLRSGLKAELFRPWARAWFDRLVVADAALGGETLALDSRADPRLVQRAIDAARTTAEASRLRQLLHAHARPEWQDLPGARWTWIWVEPGTERPLARIESWMGVVVDGSWRRWERGLLTTKGLGDGLHRIVVIDPPGF